MDSDMDPDALTPGVLGQQRSRGFARARRFAVPTICLVGLATVGTAAGAWALSPGHSGPHDSGPPPARASGTVASVGSTSFTLTPSSGTPESGSAITVDTSARTNFTQTTTANVSDASSGTFAVVTGTRASDGSLAAGAIAIVPAPPRQTTTPTTDNDSGDGDHDAGDADAPRNSFAFGEVTSNTSGTVTLATREGTQTVTTTSSTVVTSTVKAGFSSVGTGDAVSVVGHAGGQATIEAFIVNLGVEPAVDRFGPPHGGPGRGGPGTPGWPGSPPSPRTTAVTRPAGSAPVSPGSVSGTVGSVSAPNFTVNESNGSTMTVVTSTSTHYALTAAAAVTEATPGSFVVAQGTRAANGSLAAAALSILPGTGSSGSNGLERLKRFERRVERIEPGSGRLSRSRARG